MSVNSSNGWRRQGIFRRISFGGDGATDAEQTQKREDKAFFGHSEFAIQANHNAVKDRVKKWSVHLIG